MKTTRILAIWTKRIDETVRCQEPEAGKRRFDKVQRRHVNSLLTSIAAVVVLLLAGTLDAAQESNGYPNGVPPVPARKPPAPLAGPTPRTPEGKTDFSGVWVISGKTTLPSDPSYLPSAKNLYDQRKEAKGKGDPESYCLPDGAARVTDLPYKIVQGPKMIVLLSEGNVHSYRRFFLDGRTQKAALDVEPETRSGISVGKWDGDALVVDTIGFDDKTWLDSTGKPHSAAMHLTERYTRPDLGHINVQITIEDEKALTKPYTFSRIFTLAPGWELQEYVCQAVLDGIIPAPTAPLN